MFHAASRLAIVFEIRVGFDFGFMVVTHVVEPRPVSGSGRTGRPPLAKAKADSAEPFSALLAAAVENPLFALPNVVIAPHVAGVTREALDRMGEQTARNILSALDGDAIRQNVINQDVLN